MLPANWEALEVKAQEKELYQRGLFPHVTSGHLQPDGTFSIPKHKKMPACQTMHNEAVCTGYSPESIDCFIISSNVWMFANHKDSPSWSKCLLSALDLQKEMDMPPTPFVFYNINGGRFSKPYHLEELFPGLLPKDIYTLLEDWQEYARYSGFCTKAISQLAWHYPAHEICQRMKQWHHLVCGDAKTRLSLNIALHHAKTPEQCITLVKKGADLNQIFNRNSFNHTLFCHFQCLFFVRCLLDGMDFSRFQAFVSTALEHGVNPGQVSIDTNWLKFDLTYMARLIEQGADTKYTCSNQFRLTRQHTAKDIDALLKIHRHLSAKGENVRPPLEYLPESITSPEDIERIRHFFLCLNSLNIKLDREGAARYINTVISSAERIRKQQTPDNQQHINQYVEEITRLGHENQRLPESALLPALAPPSARQAVTPFDAMQPICKLFQRSPLILSDKNNPYITTQEILAHYYLTPDSDTAIIKTLRSGKVDKYLMRKFHGCDHVLRCTVLGDALMESFKKHDAQYRTLLSQDPQLEQLILIAILMHDITAEIEDESQEELSAAREFKDLTERNGFPPALIDKVATALMNKNTDIMPSVLPPFIADSDQPEDIRMITRLIRLPDCMDNTRIHSLPKEFPEAPEYSCPDILFDFNRMDLGGLAPTHPELISEIKTLLVGSERLASLSGGQSPSDSRLQPAFWEQHKLLNPKIHHNERRHWLAYSPAPLAAMDSVLDDIVRLQIASKAGIENQSDLQLKQVPCPGFLSNREKLLISAGQFPDNLLPYVKNLKMRHRSGMDKPLGTLTQETLGSGKARRELLKRKIDVRETVCFRAHADEVYAKRKKCPTPAPDYENDDTNVYDYVKMLVFPDSSAQ